MASRGFQSGPVFDTCTRLPYNTASDQTLRLSLSPGNRIVYLFRKVGKAPKTTRGPCPGQLQGVRAMRPKVLRRLFKTKKHVSRACVGVPCELSACVTGSSVPSFLRRRKSLRKCGRHNHRVRKLSQQMKLF
ncbi:unnamed protein product [Gulo gulo]|uniref:Large ribosomal subunit protein eL34 n=1 Tax=Gulo gulo TaxID=48420 RepID=A0A9X9LLJ8_GULGU|nr:unnamed protein product [Gulo gulo]